MRRPERPYVSALLSDLECNMKEYIQTTRDSVQMSADQIWS